MEITSKLAPSLETEGERRRRNYKVEWNGVKRGKAREEKEEEEDEGEEEEEREKEEERQKKKQGEKQEEEEEEGNEKKEFDFWIWICIAQRCIKLHTYCSVIELYNEGTKVYSGW